MDPGESFADLVRFERPPGPSNLVEPIARYLATRGTAKRATITRELEVAWRNAGGAPLSGTDWGSKAEVEAWSHRVKRALSKLQDEGRVREARDRDGKRVHGTWEWLAEESPREGGAAYEAAEVNVGSGEHLVYGLYNERDKDAALAKGENAWLVKVGKTRASSPYQRIQDGAFLPDKLIWGIALWTDDADADERLVKAVLARRGHRYDGTGGTEWFLTSPDEIRDLYVSMVGDA